jgi:hypothetical protein
MQAKKVTAQPSHDNSSQCQLLFDLRDGSYFATVLTL